MNIRMTAILLGAALAAVAQQSDVIIKIEKGAKTAIAAPDLRGSGAAQQHMGVFNQTLWTDLESAGIFRLVPKSLSRAFVPR